MECQQKISTLPKTHCSSCTNCALVFWQYRDSNFLQRRKTLIVFVESLVLNMSIHQRKPAAKSITDAAKKVETKIENTLTVLWNDLPSWQQDNHYIHSGYRPASASFRRSFASLGYLHNESVNIYSHLIGAIGFIVAGSILYTVIKPRYESATLPDCLAFGSFFLGAAACLGMSATYHAISYHSPTVAKFGNKLDYVGIVSLITGSFIPTIYYGFYCYPHIQEAYWFMVCESTCLFKNLAYSIRFARLV